MRTGAGLLIVAGIAIALTLLLAFGATDPLDLPLRDAAIRLLPEKPATATVVLAIDESSIRQGEPWPWPRAFLAQIVNRAADAGARGIVVDVLLTDPRDDDERLAESLRRLPAITVAAVDERGEWLLPVPPIRVASTVAHGNFELDHDGIVRRLASTKQNRDASFTAVAVEAASIAGRTKVPIGRAITPALRTPPRSIPVVTVEQLLREPSAAARLRGKLVFFGPIALALGDRVLTPVSRNADPGVTVHAAAAESLIHGDEIREASPIADGAIGASVVGLVLALRRTRAMRFIATAVAIALIIGGGLALLAIDGIAIPFGTLLLTAAISLIAVELAVLSTILHRGRAAAKKIESGLGMHAQLDNTDVGPRLEGIATRLVEQRHRDSESKRVLAHELKTPLASMRGLSQLLTGFELSDVERRRVASLLETEAGKLESMVHGLLDIERLPMRDFQTSSALVDLGTTAAERVHFLQASTDRTLNVEAAEGIVVRADAALIERVIDNLVGNALKYTPSSSPVFVAARHDALNAILEVEDRGSGISDADRERIFQRFFRGASATGTEGLGLGLSLVEEIARWHNGSVAVERASSGGSIFRLTLPLAAAYAKAGGT